MGTSGDTPMRFLMPNDLGLVKFEVWNTSKGKYLKDQTWEFHGRIIADYIKEDGATYEAGICIPMDAPYSDVVDCISIKPSSNEPLDSNTSILWGLRNHTNWQPDSLS